MCNPPAGKDQAKSGPWGFWTTSFFSLAILGTFILIQGAIAVVFAVAAAVKNGSIDVETYSVELAGNGFFLAIATIIAAPLCTALVLLFARLRRGMPVRTYLALKGPSRKQLVVWCAVMVAFMVLSDTISLSLGRPIVPVFMVDIYRTSYFAPALFVALLIGAPVFEETYIRGFVFQGLRNSWMRGPGAVILTAICWSALHIQYDAYGIFSVFICGLVLGVARLKTGSVYLTILLHSFMNLVATIETVIYANISG